ncbi:MAG TPA: hypothetical protein VKP61_04095 [Candidatus Acidoferrum sp.]|nr:hypothetical protein [Candidatus Acidoferrum sp.]
MFFALVIPFFGAKSAHAQETVFDVPSADILDRGKVYGELDGTARPVNPVYTFTPRVVVGIGHQIEIGANFDGLTLPVTGELEISPTIKWKVWNVGSTGWAFYVGDDLFFPARQRSYNAGNYSYAFFAKEWKHGTRVGLGGYDFTKNVVAPANRAGGQFTLEQNVSSRLTLAAEWYTGNNATGYVNPGAIIKITSKLTGFAAYQIGNAGVTKGNHQFLWEFGYNFN